MRQIYPLSRASLFGLLLTLCVLAALSSRFAHAEDSGSELYSDQTAQQPVPAVPTPPEPSGEEKLAELAKFVAAQQAQGNWQVDDSHGGMALLIPILAVLFLFGGPVLVIVIFTLLYFRSKVRRERTQSENVLRLIEAGREVPIELLRGDEASNTPQGSTYLHRGMRNIGLGLGIFLCLMFLFGFSWGSIGFIFIALGISQLIVWKIADSKIAPTQPQGME